MSPIGALLAWCSGDCSLVIFCIKVLFFYG